MRELTFIPVIRLDPTLGPGYLERQLGQLDSVSCDDLHDQTLQIQFPSAMRARVARGVQAMVDAETGVDPPNRFQKLGNGWLISYNGLERVYPDLVGFTYLHELLCHPRHSVAVQQLMGAAAVNQVEECQVEEAMDLCLTDEGDLGELVDGVALAQTRTRLAELDEEADEARELLNWERLERIENEKDACLKYLASAYRLDGSLRKTGSVHDKKRQAVWKAIHRAYEDIGEQDQDLLLFLKESITTASTCRYDPAVPPRWRL